MYFDALAVKFPSVKFVKSISTTCIPNYPDKNLPTIFVYHEDKMVKQFIGPLEFNGEKLKQDDLEWKLHRAGVLASKLDRSMISDYELQEDLYKAEDNISKQIRQSMMKGYNDSDEDY